MSKTMTHGDFSALAEDYANHRPDYAPGVVETILALVKSRRSAAVEAADVGAGTGIFTRMLADAGASCVAVEPCAEMREAGERGSRGLPIEWRAGSAENTGLATGSQDLLTMASSFHWADFDVATREFRRVLREDGVFVALWNPRYLAPNPMLVEIEAYLNDLVPELNRVSSGTSAFTAELDDRLRASPCFAEVIYLEGQHVIEMTPERYLGAWHSVNDIQVQAGPERFAKFLDYVTSRIAGQTSIAATYKTRAWVALC